MPNYEIGVGTVFIRQGVALPSDILTENIPYSRGWSTVIARDCFTLDKIIRASGWGFFFMAGEIRALSFGLRAPAPPVAIRRVLAKVPPQFNAAEITRVAGKRFLGLAFVTVSAYARHIQDHPYLYAPDRPLPRFAPAHAKVATGAETPVPALGAVAGKG